MTQRSIAHSSSVNKEVPLRFLSEILFLGDAKSLPAAGPDSQEEAGSVAVLNEERTGLSSPKGESASMGLMDFPNCPQTKKRINIPQLERSGPA